MLTSAVGGKQLCCFGSNGYWRVFQHPTGVQPTCCEGIETDPKIATVPSSRSASIGAPPPDRFRHQDPRRKAGFGVNLGCAPLYDPSSARCSSRPGRCMACRSRIRRSRMRRIPLPSAPGGARSSSCGTVIGFEARHHLQQRDGGDVPDQGQQVLPRLPMPRLPPIRRAMATEMPAQAAAATWEVVRCRSVESLALSIRAVVKARKPASSTPRSPELCRAPGSRCI